MYLYSNSLVQSFCYISIVKEKIPNMCSGMATQTPHVRQLGLKQCSRSQYELLLVNPPYICSKTATVMHDSLDKNSWTSDKEHKFRFTTALNNMDTA